MDLSAYIVKEKENFYFDPSDEIDQRFSDIRYQDGDKILWKWEGKKYCGILRKLHYCDTSVFLVQKVQQIC